MFGLLGVGFVSGIAMGMVGIGGGIVLLVMLLGIGVAFQEAVAISLVMQAIPQTLPAAWMYLKKGYVHVPRTAVVIAGSLLGVIVGAWIATKGHIPERVMGQILTVLVALSLIFLIRRYFF